MNIFDKTMSALEKQMDLRFKRHVVLSGNIANNETPKYRAREVDFAGELSRVLTDGKGTLRKTDEKHFNLGGHNKSSHVVFDESGAVNADGNNVDLDIQMGKLSSNARAYSGATNLLQMKLRIFRLISNSRGA